MALVYSYIRFSAKKQEQGDSLRRQVELRDEWIAKNGHTLASLSLQDLGVSAFRGKNKHFGALKTFLDAIESGRVPPGSILLVENLDRLSRQGIDEAFDVFKKILRAGVTIVCLKPYEMTHTQDSINDIIGLLIPLLYFHLAFIESKNKSDRLRSAWNTKRKVLQQDGKKFNRRCPSWLQWSGKEFVLREGHEAIRFIFEQTANGVGQKQLLKELVKGFKPMGMSGRWNGAFLGKVVNDRSVLGELQPKSADEDGNRIPMGDVVKDYYPAVPGIDNTLFDRAQAAKSVNKKNKGPSSGFVNLFVGLVFNAHDGSAMHIQRTKNAKHVQRRLVSYNYLCSLPESDPVTIMYEPFERLVLRWLTELKATDLTSNKQTFSTLAEKQQELRGVEERIVELNAELQNLRTKTDHLKSITVTITTLEERAQRLHDDIRGLKQVLHADIPFTNAKDVLKQLEDAAGEDQRTLRLRLRGLIGEVVESIYIKPEKFFGRVYWAAQIFFRGGLVKQIVHGPNFDGGTDEQQSLCSFRVNLKDREAARKIKLFERMAELEAQAAPVPIIKDVPNVVGKAATLWLQKAKASIRKESFKTVPSKIRRFVEFLGEDLPTIHVNLSRWNKWRDWLKGEISAQRLVESTARVTYNRCKEFVTFLIHHGVTPAFSLDESAAKAIKG